MMYRGLAAVHWIRAKNNYLPFFFVALNCFKTRINWHLHGAHALKVNNYHILSKLIKLANMLWPITGNYDDNSFNAQICDDSRLSKQMLWAINQLLMLFAVAMEVGGTNGILQTRSRNGAKESRKAGVSRWDQVPSGAKINCQSGLLCGSVLGWTSPVIFMGLLWPGLQPQWQLWGWGHRALPHWGFTAASHLPSPLTPRLWLGYENTVVIHHRVFFCHPQHSLAREGVICSPFNFTCKLDHIQRLSPSSFAKGVFFCWHIQGQIWRKVTLSCY